MPAGITGNAQHICVCRRAPAPRCAAQHVGVGNTRHADAGCGAGPVGPLGAARACVGGVKHIPRARERRHDLFVRAVLVQVALPAGHAAPRAARMRDAWTLQRVHHAPPEAARGTARPWARG
eukprot:260222-Chlamydomonas_euryale.AAC.1